MRKTLLVLALTGVFVLIGAIFFPFAYLAPSRSFHEVPISADGYQISGYLSEGTSADGPWIVFAHGNRTVGQNHVLYRSITHNLDGKATVLAIDFRGFGKSSAQGLAAATDILDRQADIDAAISYLQRNYGARDEQIILIGHSLGSLQILNAGKNHDYRLLIPIGPANFDVFLENPERLDNYAGKFERNTGVRLTSENLLKEGKRFTPEALFSPCPTTPVAFVFGTHDLGEALGNHRDLIPDPCESGMNWITIPFANHVYGTEARSFPEPLQSIYSAFTRTFLIWQLNGLIE